MSAWLSINWIRFKFLHLKKVLISFEFLKVTLEKEQSTKEQSSMVPSKTRSAIFVSLNEVEFHIASTIVLLPKFVDLNPTPVKSAPERLQFPMLQSENSVSFNEQ